MKKLLLIAAILSSTAHAQVGQQPARRATVSDITAGAGVVVTPSGTVFSVGLQPCTTAGDYLTWNGTTYACTAAPSTGTAWYLSATTTDAAASKTADIERTGRVGVGITPTIPLEVGTPLGNYGIGHTSGTIRLQSWLGTGAHTGAYFGTRSNDKLVFMTNDAVRFVIDPLLTAKYPVGRFSLGGAAISAADGGYFNATTTAIQNTVAGATTNGYVFAAPQNLTSTTQRGVGMTNTTAFTTTTGVTPTQLTGSVNTTSVSGAGTPFLMVGSDNTTTVAIGSGATNTVMGSRSVATVNAPVTTFEGSRNAMLVANPAVVTTVVGENILQTINASATASTVTGASINQTLNGTTTNAFGLRLVQSGTGSVNQSTLFELGIQQGLVKKALMQTDATAYSQFQGRVSFGLLTTPTNNVHVGTAVVANTAGIRTPLTSASAVGTSTAYLAVDANGDIVRGAAPISSPANYTSSQNNGAAFTLPAKQITYRGNTGAATVTLPTCALGDWTTFIQEGAGAVITYSASVRNNGVASTTYTGSFKHQLVCANSGFWTVIN